MVKLSVNKKFFAEKFEELVSVFDDLVHLSLLLRQNSVQAYINTGETDYLKLKIKYSGLTHSTDSKSEAVIQTLCRLDTDRTVKHLKKAFLDYVKALLEFNDELMIDMASNEYYSKANDDRQLISNIQREIILYFKEPENDYNNTEDNTYSLNQIKKTA